MALALTISATEIYIEGGQHKIIRKAPLAGVDVVGGTNINIYCSNPKMDYQLEYGDITSYNGGAVPVIATIVTALRNMTVDTGTTVSLAGFYAEDSAHTTGDEGVSVLAVRNDAGSAMAADGDYHPLTVNQYGMLNVNLDTVRDAAPEIGEGEAGGGTLRVSVAGTSETPTMAVYTNNQTIAAGKKSVTILTNSSFSGTILTAAAEADTAYTWAASNNNTIGAIAVVCNAGGYTVLATEVV